MGAVVQRLLAWPEGRDFASSRQTFHRGLSPATAGHHAELLARSSGVWDLEDFRVQSAFFISCLSGGRSFRDSRTLVPGSAYGSFFPTGEPVLSFVLESRIRIEAFLFP